jgi:hypothetical protein
MDGVQSANEVGIPKIGNVELLHMAFTEPAADWQLWLTRPNQVLPHRLAIVYKKLEGQPRVMLNFHTGV